MYTNTKQVEDLFFEIPTFKKEYLIKVNIKRADQIMICEIIREPQEE
ncbi:hypothetical protein [Tenacibaculum finnmarkense]|nr:hypothetical protein [Tenacibaculum finnmarkense]MCG8732250.1 hypothetical protein [Tenacibaculum finnmarkense]MCG8752919.1 hypothetical protein [Tenacibaculum finnmarkense]MCG8776339.1 hypothetical protein [Tenacibaculum finnmarkense]MCG8873347.1 hypothetical protein [Tenacibaculum finnmarkense]